MFFVHLRFSKVSSLLLRLVCLIEKSCHEKYYQLLLIDRRAYGMWNVDFFSSLSFFYFSSWRNKKMTFWLLDRVWILEGLIKIDELYHGAYLLIFEPLKINFLLINGLSSSFITNRLSQHLIENMIMNM